ncbi:glycosyltransferase [Haloparvum sedimenti]|uniref:glycosyltransferase n=1 Tax=Haloparvum sedimenti TaxID=1678448 RepID=UPI00071E8683|nr:glycosyltransferase [Haloparvum sedimenti]
MLRSAFDRADAVVRRAAERTGVLTGSATLLGVGLWQGVQVQGVTLALWVISLRVLYLDAVATFVGFTAFFALAGGLLLWEVTRRRDEDRYLYEGPTVDALIPVYRDGEVLERSVESLLDSEYADLRIRVITEPGDCGTRGVAEALAAEHPAVEVLENGRPGSKAGAINDAVARSDAEHFLVFDADEVVAPSFVPAAVGALEHGADVFQGRRVPEPTGLVETLAYCERALFHASYKPVELTGFANCRSSSTAFTREALATVGGYADCLTEDLEFAHACYRHGLDVEQCRNHVNLMEAPHTVGDLWGQRKRWRTGQVEVLHRTLLGKGDGSHRRRLLSLGRLVSSMLGSLLTLTLASKFAVLMLADLAPFYLAPVLVVGATVGGLIVRDRADGAVDGAHPVWLATPLLVPFFGVLTLSSVLGYALTWDGDWFRVAKTAGS